MPNYTSYNNNHIGANSHRNKPKNYHPQSALIKSDSKGVIGGKKSVKQIPGILRKKKNTKNTSSNFGYFNDKSIDVGLNGDFSHFDNNFERSVVQLPQNFNAAQKRNYSKSNRLNSARLNQELPEIIITRQEPVIQPFPEK